MSLIGHIQNGVVVFDEPVDLPDGTVVEVAVRAATESGPGPAANRDEDIFAEMRAFMVDVQDVDDSREAMYTRMMDE